MAKVKLASFLADLSGKLGQAVFTKGRSVLAMRTKVRPRNPQSAYQTLVRNAVALWSAAWRALSEANITAWNDAAADPTKKNTFGDSYATTGHKMYVAYNTTNSLYGSAVEIPAPLVPVAPSPIGVSAINFDTAPETATVTTDDAVPANTDLLVFASSQCSAGVSNFKGKLIFIKKFPAGTAAGDLDILTEYKAHFGSLVQNEKVAVQCFLTNTHATLRMTTYKNGAELASKVK